MRMIKFYTVGHKKRSVGGYPLTKNKSLFYSWQDLLKYFKSIGESSFDDYPLKPLNVEKGSKQ